MLANLWNKLKLQNIFLKLSPIVPPAFPLNSQYSDFFPFINNNHLSTTLYALNYSFFLQPQLRDTESVVVSLFDHSGSLIRTFSHTLDAEDMFSPIMLSNFLPLNAV